MNAADQSETKLLEIVDAIRTLSPAQRRRLQRRLRASGLTENDELLTDRDKLHFAPALGVGHRSDTSTRAVLRPVEHPVVTGAEDASTPIAENEEYQPSVRAKVVVAGADDESVPLDVAASVTGQAPEQPIGVIFDGGVRGEPSQGYGSYAIRWPGIPQQIVQLRFGDGVSANEAIYDALIAALESVLQQLEDNNASPATATLDIRGDSAQIISQTTGQTECEAPSIQLRCDRVRLLLERIGSWRLSRYHPDRSVDANES